jgi:hypothetical protein
MEQNSGIQTMPTPTNAGEIIGQGGTLQQVQTNFQTAISVQKPRNLNRVMEACVQEAELSGEAFYYHWETTTTDKNGKKKISIVEGPSIQCSLAAARHFGNCAIQQKPVIETKSSYIFTACFVDLETGFTIERQFRIDKNYKVYGDMDQFRKDDIRFQIGQSKAIRNAILNAVPMALTNRMVQAAIDSTRLLIEQRIKKYGGKIKLVIDDMLKSFAKFDVTQAMIETKLDQKIKTWTIETLVLLSGDLSALTKGQATVEELFGISEEAPQEKPENPKLGKMSLSGNEHQGYNDSPNSNGKPDPAQKQPLSAFAAEMEMIRKEVIRLDSDKKFIEELGSLGYESIEDVPKDSSIRSNVLKAMYSVVKALAKEKNMKLEL